MKIVNLVQGSKDWHAHRAAHWNASDAPAMLGVSPYKTRAALVRECATGVTAEVDAATQRRFDDGHRFEALARPLAEAIIGEDLYPCVGVQDGSILSASFDGLTMLQDIAFEHKTLNDALRAVMVDYGTGADLPEYHRVQCEQQCMVSGCDRVLFMATRWNGEALAEPVRQCWYTPNSVLAARIVDGWKQFDADVVAYQARETAAPAPIGRAPDKLPTLRIEVTGMVTQSNLAEWEAVATAMFAGINRDLSTDQDFADAELAVKGCSDIESQLEAAKERILSGTESIEATFKTIDRMREQARQTRLALSKLVEAQKMSRRMEIVERGKQAVIAHYSTINASLGTHAIAHPPALVADLGLAIKGKKSFSSMDDAVDSAVANLKIAASQQADRVRANIAALSESEGEYASLFPDRVQLCAGKATDDLRNLAAARIAEHEKKEELRMAAEWARVKDQEVARIRQEYGDQERARLAEIEKARLSEAASLTQGDGLAPPFKVDRDKLDPSYGEVYVQEPYQREATIQERAAMVQPIREPDPTPATGETIKLGDINARIVPLTISADGMSRLGFDPISTQGAAKLYRASDFERMIDAMVAQLRCGDRMVR